MCSRQILILIIEIADLINDLMRASFVLTDAKINSQLAQLPWADKIKVDNLDKKPTEVTASEASIKARKAFMLLCDLYNLKLTEPGDIKGLQDSAIYLTLLSNTVMNMPGFTPGAIDPISEESYTSAVRNLSDRQWFTMKNDLVICHNMIYSPAPQTEDPYTHYTNAAHRHWNAEK